MSGHHHRPSLKQSNKSFKSKKASKGSLKDAAKGRVESNSGNGVNGKKQRSGASMAAAQSKASRRNTAKQIHLQKRAAIVEKNRLTKGNGEARAPRVVAVIQLCKDTSNEGIIGELLEGAADLLASQVTQLGGIKQVEWVALHMRNCISQADRALCHSLNNPRATLQFLTPPHGDLIANLDALAVADFVVLSLSGSQEVDSWGEICLRSMASLGVGDGAVR